MPNTGNSFKFDLLMRLRLIEVVALWEGKVNSHHLMNAFGIQRQQASRDISKYRTEVAPNNLEYCHRQKAYIPTKKFKPMLTYGQADEYLQLPLHNYMLEASLSRLNSADTHTYGSPVPSRHIEPVVLRALIQACEHNHRLEVDYRSVNDPQPDGRVICPHSIVYATNRWHVRAYCEKNQDFRDFVLTRFFGKPEKERGKAKFGREDDKMWNKKLKVIITADRRLTADQQLVIEHDYGMKRGQLEIDVQACLLGYLLKELRIDGHTVHADPRAQQVVVKNIEELKPYLFD